MRAAASGDVERIPDVGLYWCGELAKVFKTRTNPDHRFERWLIGYWKFQYSDITIRSQRVVNAIVIAREY
jgi:hypothetical protein